MKSAELTNIGEVDEERRLVAAAANDPDIAPIALRAPLSALTDACARDVYGVVRDLVMAGKNVDLITVGMEMNKRGLHEAKNVVLFAYDGIVTRGQAEEIVENLRYRAESRRLRVALEKALQGLRESGRVGEVKDELLTSIASGERFSARRPVTIFDAVQDLRDTVENKVAGQQIYTGFDNVDRMLRGLGQSQMIVLAARPGLGKSALALDWAEHIARSYGPVMLVTLEMRARELAARVVARHHQVETRSMSVAQCGKSAESLRSVPLYIYDWRMTFSQLLAELRVFKLQHPNMAALFLDYLQLVKRDDSRLNRYEFVTELSASLKNLANDLGIPVIVLAQLNRNSESEKRPPTKADLRDSGGIEQDANKILLLWKDDSNDHWLIVDKNREGPTGNIRLTFRPETTTFRDTAPRRVELSEIQL